MKQAQLIELALARGYLTQEQVTLCRKVQFSRGGALSLDAVMLELGFIDEAQQQELLAGDDAAAAASDEQPAAAASDDLLEVPVDVEPDVASDDELLLIDDPATAGELEFEPELEIVGADAPAEARGAAGTGEPADLPVGAGAPPPGRAAPVAVVPAPALKPVTGGPALAPVTPVLSAPPPQVAPAPEGAPAPPSQSGFGEFEVVGDEAAGPTRPVSEAEVAALVAEAADDADDPLIGRELAGCVIVAKIASGGMAAVYRVQHQFIGATMAMKVLPPQVTEQPQVVERFLREAHAARQIVHENIVRVMDAGKAEGVYYLLMEYVEGQNLRTIVEAQGKLSVADAVYMAKEVARGLGAVHEAGLVHRDIKPENILIAGPRVVVTDFGLVKIDEGEAGDELGKLTMPGQILGSPYFMAPEVGEGREADARADLYSLGATLYYAVTGRYPFDGPTPLAIIHKHATERLVPPRRHVPKLPPSVNDVIVRLMHKRKEQRPKSAATVLRDLERIRLREKSSFAALPGAAAASGSAPGAGPSKASLSPPRTAAPVTSARPVTVAAPPPLRPITGAGVQGGVPVSAPVSAEHTALVEAMAKEARRLLDQRKLNEARALIAKGLSRFPSAESLTSLRDRLPGLEKEKTIHDALESATALMRKGQAGQAAIALKDVYALEPEHPGAQAIQAAIEQLKTKIPATVERAMRLKEDSQFLDAEKLFLSVLKVEPDHRLANVQLKQLEARRREARKHVETAKQAFQEGDLDSAKAAAAAAIQISPSDPAVRAVLGEIEQQEGILEEALGQARQFMDKGRFDEAIAKARETFATVADNAVAKRFIEQAQDKREAFDAGLAAGIAAFERADFRTADREFRRAQEAFFKSPVIKRHLTELGPIVRDVAALDAQAQELAEAGDLEAAIACWREALDKSPGDQELPGIIGDAETHHAKLTRLEHQAAQALKKKDFESATKAYRAVLQIEAGHARAKEELARIRVRQASHRRLRRVRRVVFALVLLVGSTVGVFFWLSYENKKAFAEAEALLAKARAEEDLQAFQAAQQKLNQLVALPLIGMPGVDPGAYDQCLAKSRQGNKLKLAREAVKAGRFEEAAALFETLGLPARANRVRLVAHEQRYEEARKRLLDAVGVIQATALAPLVGDAQAQKALKRELAAIPELNKSLVQTRASAEAVAGQLGQEPTLPRLPQDVRAFIASAKQEAKRLNDVLEGYEEFTERKLIARIIEGPRSENTVSIEDVNGYFNSILDEIDCFTEAITGTQWPDKYAAWLAEAAERRAFARLAQRWFVVWFRYDRAYKGLERLGREAGVEPAALAVKFRALAADFTALAQDVRDAPEPSDPALAGALARLRQKSQMPGIGARTFEALAALLDAVDAVGSVAVVLPSEETAGLLVSILPVTTAAFEAFRRAGGYESLEHWGAYTGQSIMRGLPKDAVRQSFLSYFAGPDGKPGPRVSTEPEAAVQGLSWFEASAFAQWRAKRDNVRWRLPTAKEFADANTAGALTPLTTPDSAAREWTSASKTDSSSGAMLSAAVQETDSAEWTTVWLKSMDDAPNLVFHLVTDFPFRKLARPALAP